tara:strand:- start:499 stop:942 length:444 start_codon:yes stop_codon:yes gene_type:complete
MKKQSTFKMKGFSGFGSPIEKNGILDTKFKDVKKNITNKFNTIKENIGNTTLRDVLKTTPHYHVFKKIKRTTDKVKQLNALESLADTNSLSGVMGLKNKKTKKTLKKTKTKPVKTIEKLNVKKMPVANNMRIVNTPKKYRVPKNKKS